MSDLHGGRSGPWAEGTSGAVPRRGRRVRPGAVPDARSAQEEQAGPTAWASSASSPTATEHDVPFDEIVAPQPVDHDRDTVFDVEAGAHPDDHRDGAVGQHEGHVYSGDEYPGDQYSGDEADGADDAYEDEAYEHPLDDGHHDDGHHDDGHHDDVHHDDADYDAEDEEDDEDLHEVHAAPGARRRGRNRRRGRTVAALVICLALLGGAVYAGWSFLSPIVAELAGGDPPPEDYPGPGTGEVDIVIEPGDTGGAIGDTLLAAGVVASRAAFVAEFTATPEAASLQPGTYRVRSQMKASDALALLLDPASRQSIRVGVPEGLWVSETLPAISEDTGFSVEELQAALADPAIGLPPEAGDDPEGYLFPATYDFEPDTTPVEVLTAMVARHTQAMDDLGVSADQRRDVLIRASIIQGEASRAEDLPKVSRVIQNRLDRGETLGMDSTVGYIVQKRALDLTASDLQTDSPYNTRINTGLPPGPINNPGEAAIAAAMAPAEGDWLYFVTVDGETGETVFTSDYDEFLAAKRQFQEWLAENG